MTDHELYTKLKEAALALETYQTEKATFNRNSIWANDIQQTIGDISTRTKVLGASGRPCIRCHGSGIEPGT